MGARGTLRARIRTGDAGLNAERGNEELTEARVSERRREGGVGRKQSCQTGEAVDTISHPQPVPCPRQPSRGTAGSGGDVKRSEDTLGDLPSSIRAVSTLFYFHDCLFRCGEWNDRMNIFSTGQAIAIQVKWRLISSSTRLNSTQLNSAQPNQAKPERFSRLLLPSARTRASHLIAAAESLPRP
ncbi:uncharacterized protein VTP21DRAFT_8890 [Calcarisporiella thermophila]|uniref:uncharacterized protein n=1 Tax=Calcarisporiella thermophila TaxID=911321 RepID=UPI0037427799